MTEDEVRKHTRFMIDSCAAGGGWAMGTGNSVTDYIPAANFLAMVEETMA
jgi:uroporphyrinogen decarboxylase